MAELVALAAQYRDAFLLVFVRLSGLLLAAPAFGHRAIPVPHRVGLAAALALVLAPVVGVERAALGSGAGLLAALAGELLVGLLIGLVAGLAVAAVVMAAELVGFQMGLGVAAAWDPALGQQSTALTRLWEMLALVFFLSVNGHHGLLLTVAASFQRLPAGQAPAVAGAAGGLVALGGKLLRSALEMAAPLVAVLFVVNVVLALLARVAPQMNVFIVGLPLALAVGLFGLVETLPHLLSVLGRLVGELGGDVRLVLGGAGRGL